MNYQVGEVIKPEQAMELAIAEASKAQGFVSPNPLVGCVIVDKNHGFLSSGYHQNYGGPHAEVDAIANAPSEDLLVGGTIYVTLEPCSHYGKTPPCCELIAQKKLAKVVYGIKDPNPLVAGRGLKYLKDRGVAVEHSQSFQPRIEKLTEQFLHHIIMNRPFMALKMGVSFDGKICLASGESQWITSNESRLHARQLRAHYDATLIGAGTYLSDNPTLDFRGTRHHGHRKNKVVIFDPKGRIDQIDPKSNLAQAHGLKNIFIVTGVQSQGLEKSHPGPVILWKGGQQGWEMVLEELYQNGLFSIFAEGGAFVFGQLLQFQLAQKIYCYQSPKILGRGKSWSEAFHNESLLEVPEAKDWQSKKIGSDLFHTLYL